jgi:hypothetical protein
MRPSPITRELQPLPSVIRQRKLTDIEHIRLQNAGRDFAAVIIFALVGLVAILFLSASHLTSVATAVPDTQLP